MRNTCSTEFLWVSSLFMMLASCVSYNRPYALNDPSAQVLQDTPSFAALLTQYNAVTADREAARNEILRRLMLMDDGYFLRYTLTLYNGRAFANTATIL
jgi:hypothetical protein